MLLNRRIPASGRWRGYRAQCQCFTPCLSYLYLPKHFKERFSRNIRPSYCWPAFITSETREHTGSDNMLDMRWFQLPQKELDFNGNTPCPLLLHWVSSCTYSWLSHFHRPGDGLLVLQACGAVIEDIYLPSMEYGMQECAWNQLLPQKKKSPECSDKPKAYKCTQLVSSKAGKDQASLAVLDLGYPRDRIKIPVWEVLGRFTKLELWGGHRASIFLQVHSYEYFSEEHFQFFPTLPT